MCGEIVPCGAVVWQSLYFLSCLDITVSTLTLPHKSDHKMVHKAKWVAKCHSSDHLIVSLLSVESCVIKKTMPF